jgi:hypothetical protein
MALAIDELSSLETDLLAGKMESSLHSAWPCIMIPSVAGLDLPLGNLDSPLSLLDDVRTRLCVSLSSAL